jgi:hypothetical protein
VVSAAYAPAAAVAHRRKQSTSDARGSIIASGIIDRTRAAASPSPPGSADGNAAQRYQQAGTSTEIVLDFNAAAAAASGSAVSAAPLRMRFTRLVRLLWYVLMGRDSGNEYAHFLNAYGHLFLAYSDAFWFLGPVSLLRKAALVAVLQFGGSVRGVLASLLLGAFLLLYAQQAPFRAASTTFAAELCSFCLLLLLMVVVSGEVVASAVPPLVALAVLTPWVLCVLDTLRRLLAARARRQTASSHRSSS